MDLTQYEKNLLVVNTLQKEEMTSGSGMLPIMGGIQTKNANGGVQASGN